MTDLAVLREKWDDIYRAAPHTPQQPAQVLTENAHLLPTSGVALDLACGLGGNAMFLARAGLQVQAWDLSPVAIERVQSSGVGIEAEVRDVENQDFPGETFDVVVVSRFLTRRLAPAIAGSLRRGGLLYYQTYVAEKLSDSGPSNSDYLLERNELLRLFADFRVLHYREDGRVGDLSRGRRDEAYFVGQKL